MKCVAFSIALGLFLGAMSPVEEWRSEHRDCLLVPPHAIDISFRQYTDGEMEISYFVQEPYPAKALLTHITESLLRQAWNARPELAYAPFPLLGNGWRVKGGHPTVVGSPPQVAAAGGQHVWVGGWENSQHDRVKYELEYPSQQVGQENMLRVKARFIPESAVSAMQVEAHRRSGYGVAAPSRQSQPTSEKARLGILSPLATHNIGAWAVMLLYSTMFIGGGLLIWIWPQATLGMIREMSIYVFTIAVLIPWTIAIPTWLYDSHWNELHLVLLIVLAACLSYVLQLVSLFTSPRGRLKISSIGLVIFTTIPAIGLFSRILEAYSS